MQSKWLSMQPSESGLTTQAWTAAVAPEVKALSPQQLVTIGQDGFWQEDNCASNE